jgi:hypothetical protein
MANSTLIKKSLGKILDGLPAQLLPLPRISRGSNKDKENGHKMTGRQMWMPLPALTQLTTMKHGMVPMDTRIVECGMLLQVTRDMRTVGISMSVMPIAE